jgi:hypothetical protein
LPRELSQAQREELAREAARELLGDRFVYTLAVHQPLAKDKIEQPHLHLMFSERVIDDTTRALPEDKFFKRNGAKKDPAWNDRNKPEEVRARWCEMMNRAMAREGIEVRVDPRSWANQGREDLAELREPKTLGGDGLEAVERREEIEQLRVQRQELPVMHLDGASTVQKLEQEMEAQIAAIESRLEQELSVIDKLIAALQRGVEKVREFLLGVDAFQEKADAQLAAREAARSIETSLPPPDESSRGELDRQLRQMAMKKASFPDEPIRTLADIADINEQRIRGKVLGYTSGQEEALFERRGGGLVRLDMRGKPSLPIGIEMQLDRKGREIDRGRGRER